MKQILLPRSLSAIAIGSMLAISTGGAWAASTPDRVITTETVHVEASLTPPTPAAGLGGEVTLVANDKLFSGTTPVRSQGHIEVNQEGLADGTYTVTATLASGSNQVILGNLVLPVPVTSSTTAEPDDVDAAEAEFGGDGVPLPAGLDLLDVSGIVISDSNSATVLSADLSAANAISSTFHVESSLVAGPAAPLARGHLSLISKSRKNWPGLRIFSLMAKGLPRNATVALAINGQDVATVLTGRLGTMAVLRHIGKPHLRGHRYINELPPSVDLSAIQTLSVHYAGGAELFHINL